MKGVPLDKILGSHNEKTDDETFSLHSFEKSGSFYTGTYENLFADVGGLLDNFDKFSDTELENLRMQVITTIFKFADKADISKELAVYLTNHAITNQSKRSTISSLLDEMLTVPVNLVVITKESLLDFIRGYDSTGKIEEKLNKYFDSGSVVIQKVVDSRPVTGISKILKSTPVLSSALASSLGALLKEKANQFSANATGTGNSEPETTEDVDSASKKLPDGEWKGDNPRPKAEKSDSSSNEPNKVSEKDSGC